MGWLPSVAFAHKQQAYPNYKLGEQASLALIKWQSSNSMQRVDNRSDDGDETRTVSLTASLTYS